MKNKLNEGETSQGNGQQKHQADDPVFISQVDGQSWELTSLETMEALFDLPLISVVDDRLS